MRRAVFLLAFALAAAWNVRAVAHDVSAEAQWFSQMYFAPMDGANFFRLYAPETGMVEFRRNWRWGGIEGAGGWSAVMEANGDMTVREPGVPASYTFRKGRPFSMVASDGKQLRMQFDEEPEISGEIPPMWEGAEEEARAYVVEKFRGYRLRLFYVNPNHAAMLLAELALLGLFAFLFGRGTIVILAGAAGFATAAYYLVRTDGRGAALGLALGTILLLGFRFFRRGGKVRAAIVSTLAVATVVAFFVGAGLGGRFTVQKLSWGTSERFEKWRCVPRMMVDSPYGWGGTGAGRVYSDWYQPLSSMAVTPTLDSDHLTFMTGFGWFGRFVWGFVWLAVLFPLFRWWRFSFAVGHVFRNGPWCDVQSDHSRVVVVDCASRIAVAIRRVASVESAKEILCAFSGGSRHLFFGLRGVLLGRARTIASRGSVGIRRWRARLHRFARAEYLGCRRQVHAWLALCAEGDTVFLFCASGGKTTGIRSEVVRRPVSGSQTCGGRWLVSRICEALGSGQRPQG